MMKLATTVIGLDVHIWEWSGRIDRVERDGSWYWVALDITALDGRSTHGWRWYRLTSGEYSVLITDGRI